MQRVSRGWIPAILIALAACLVACEQQPQAPPETRAGDLQALQDSDTRWSRAAGEKDVQQFVSYFADDAVFLPPNIPAMTTREAIRRWASDMMASPGLALSWQPTKADVSGSGDLGYTMGTYELTMGGPKGKPITDHGKYLTVWKKQADSSWKVEADTFNSDLPAPGAASR